MVRIFFAFFNFCDRFFFDNKQFRIEDRIDSSPYVWVLEPIPWNPGAIKAILWNNDILDSCIDSLPISDKKKKFAIKNRFVKLMAVYDDYMKMDKAIHLMGLFNLDSMMDEIQNLQTSELLYLLEKGEIYYCLSYLLIHVYLSSRQRSLSHVMPLSIVESYHSERIKTQKGAFTIFPYYEEDAKYQSAKNMKIKLDTMENMSNGNNYLHKILLYNPDQIAYEVINPGLNISWLYPEMPVVANAIENRKIFLHN